jgi:hypothetical protein
MCFFFREKKAESRGRRVSGFCWVRREDLNDLDAVFFEEISKLIGDPTTPSDDK